MSHSKALTLNESLNICLVRCSTMKFERPKGFMGSMPRNWIDNNLPRCPFCKTPSLWELAMEMKFTSYNRYHFRCPNCMAIISIAVPAVDGTTVGLGLTGLVMKKTVNKNFRIESMGNNQKLEHLVGAEYPLETLQEWARQIHEGEKK